MNHGEVVLSNGYISCSLCFRNASINSSIRLQPLFPECDLKFVWTGNFQDSFSGISLSGSFCKWDVPGKIAKRLLKKAPAAGAAPTNQQNPNALKEFVGDVKQIMKEFVGTAVSLTAEYGIYEGLKGLAANAGNRVSWPKTTIALLAIAIAAAKEAGTPAELSKEEVPAAAAGDAKKDEGFELLTLNLLLNPVLPEGSMNYFGWKLMNYFFFPDCTLDWGKAFYGEGFSETIKENCFVTSKAWQAAVGGNVNVAKGGDEKWALKLVWPVAKGGFKIAAEGLAQWVVYQAVNKALLSMGVAGVAGDAVKAVRQKYIWPMANVGLWIVMNLRGAVGVTSGNLPALIGLALLAAPVGGPSGTDIANRNADAVAEDEQGKMEDVDEGEDEDEKQE